MVLTVHQQHLKAWENKTPGGDSVGLAWSLRICISNEFPCDVDTDGSWTALGQPLLLYL